MRANAKKTSDLNAVIVLDITGPNGGKWVIDCTKEGGQVTSGSVDDAKLTVTMLDTDFVDMYGGSLSPQKAFLSGKIKVKGDMGLALKLSNIL